MTAKNGAVTAIEVEQADARAEAEDEFGVTCITEGGVERQMSLSDA